MPLITGMLRSRSATSNRSAIMAPNAILPLLTTRTRWPARSSSFWITIWFTSLSSATRIWSGWFFDAALTTSSLYSSPGLTKWMARRNSSKESRDSTMERYPCREASSRLWSPTRTMRTFLRRFSADNWSENRMASSPRPSLTTSAK